MRIHGLGDISAADWYSTYYVPAIRRINDASLQQPAELMGAMQVMVGRANAMALAMLQGDSSKAQPLGDMLGRMEYAISQWEAQDREALRDAIFAAIANAPGQVRDALIETARAAGDSLRAAGVDPENVLSAFKWVAGAVGLAALAWLLS